MNRDEMRFFYTKDKNGSPRHVVIATGEESDGKVAVERIGLHPFVEGTSKRGRPPSFLEPVEVSSLGEMKIEDVPESYIELAEQMFASPAVDVESN